jgi:hypothetical protein
MLLLNDVQDAKRLAYLLSPTLARYPRKRKSQRKVRLAVLGAGAVVWFFVWALLKGH